MPYEHLLPQSLRGRNERIDERFAPTAPAAAEEAEEGGFQRESE